jgi:hypothetical protein
LPSPALHQEHDDDLRPRIGRELSAKAYFNFVLSQVAGLVANTAWFSSLLFHAGADRQGARDRRELPGQFSLSTSSCPASEAAEASG